MLRACLFIIVLYVAFSIFTGGKSNKIVDTAWAFTPSIFFTWSDIPEEVATSVTNKSINFTGVGGSKFSFVPEAMAAENGITSKHDYDKFKSLTDELAQKVSYCEVQTMKDMASGKHGNVNEVTINLAIAKCLRDNGVTKNAYPYAEYIRANKKRLNDLQKKRG